MNNTELAMASLGGDVAKLSSRTSFQMALAQLRGPDRKSPLQFRGGKTKGRIEMEEMLNGEELAKVTAAAASVTGSVFQAYYEQLEPAIRSIALGVYRRFNSNTARRSADLNDFVDEATGEVIRKYAGAKHAARAVIATRWEKWVKRVLMNRAIDQHRNRVRLSRLMDYWNGALSEGDFKRKYKFDSDEKYARWVRQIPSRPAMVASDHGIEAADDFRIHMEVVEGILAAMNPVHAMVIVFEYDLTNWLGRELAQRIAKATGRCFNELERLDRIGIEQSMGVSAANWYQITRRFRQWMQKAEGRLAA